MQIVHKLKKADQFIRFILIDLILQKILGTLVLVGVYFLVIGPSAIVWRLFGSPGSGGQVQSDTNWVAVGDADDMRRQS